MKYFGKIILVLLFLLCNRVTAGATMPDSTFVRNIMNEFERQKPRLDRKIRRKVKKLNKTDSLYLIPALMFKGDLKIDHLKFTTHYEQLQEEWAQYATWDSLDTGKFYIAQFIDFKSTGESVVYEEPWDFTKWPLRYKTDERGVYDKLLDIIKERKPDLVFRIANVINWGYFFIERGKIFLLVDCHAGVIMDSNDAIKYLEQRLRTGDYLLFYDVYRKLVH